MPTPYHTLSDDTLNLLAERGNAQALMELGYRAERLGILAEAQELAKRLREGSTHRLCERRECDGEAIVRGDIRQCSTCGRPLPRR